MIFSGDHKLQEGSGSCSSNIPSQSSSSNIQQHTASTSQQEGFGIDADFISKVATLVSTHLAKNKAESDRKTNAPLELKTVLPSAFVSASNTVPPIPFDTQVFQNDMNDSFDQKHLLNGVPSRFQQKAKNLLEAFDDRANELTWDSAGNVYIDQVSIPQANIYKIFPKLFQTRKPKRLPGLQDVIKKITEMGLSHLTKESLKKTEDLKGQGRALPKSEGQGKVPNSQWWYIGD